MRGHGGAAMAAPCNGHYRGLQKIAKTSMTGVIGMSHDDLIEHFDFQKLTRSNQVTSDFDVRLGRSLITAYAAYGISGVIPHPVLCRMVRHSLNFSGREQLSDTA
jgi:hypothetical protein